MAEHHPHAAFPSRPSSSHLHQQGNPFSRPQTPHVGLQIGFCGLGAMGYFMARNLANRHIAHPHSATPLLVWNRSVEKSEKLLKELGDNKVKIAGSIEEIARECDMIFTNLANDTVVKDVYVQFAKALEDSGSLKPKIFVETSTIYPTLAGELDTLISAHHGRLVMAPVFGAPPVADAGKLLVVMAGDYRSKKEVAHVLIPSVGRSVIDLGGNLEKASTFKLIGNSMILGSIEILAEAFTLGERTGINASLVQTLVKELLPAPIIVGYGEKILHDAFDGTNGFAIDGGIKDATHIRRLSTETNVPMPSLDTAHQHLITARAIHAAQSLRGEHSYDTLDWSSLVAGTRVAAGLDPFDSAKHDRVVPVNED
ncbi:NAD(P)-binding protein [Cristinia sonorae]|uniref:NAD(P)-binding protein n=1 Tax=Cristinia sonorae TaxID=1940300 RepID=A0A8K0XMW2_9AGAR|nr:NAD(P)-binding protein [Cristinia sonorae]